MEHLDEYADLCDIKFKNGHLEVMGPNGNYLFGLTIEKSNAFDFDSPLNKSIEKLGIKTSQINVIDDRNSNYIKWGPKADQEVSNILNQTLLMESKFLEQKDSDFAPTTSNQTRFKEELNNITQSFSQTDSAENDLYNEDRYEP